MAIYDYQGNILSAEAKALKTPWVSESHRGFSSPTVHENTLAAYHRAWLNGAQAIETDARLSSDGIYVINHDATIKVNGVTYTIAETEASVLTSLVLSTDSVYGECKMPTLESVLKLCCYTGMNVDIDCKAIDPTTLAQMVVDSGMSGRAVYGNTGLNNCTTILSIDPNAGFTMQYNVHDRYDSYLPENRTRRRSLVWSPLISAEMIKTVKAKGYNFMVIGQTTIDNMHFAPDYIEFETTANPAELNKAYIDSLTVI